MTITMHLDASRRYNPNRSPVVQNPSIITLGRSSAPSVNHSVQTDQDGTSYLSGATAMSQAIRRRKRIIGTVAVGISLLSMAIGVVVCVISVITRIFPNERLKTLLIDDVIPELKVVIVALTTLSSAVVLLSVLGLLSIKFDLTWGFLFLFASLPMIMVGEAGVAALTLFLDGKARGWLEEQGVCQGCRIAVDCVFRYVSTPAILLLICAALQVVLVLSLCRFSSEVSQAQKIRRRRKRSRLPSFPDIFVQPPVPSPEIAREDKPPSTETSLSSFKVGRAARRLSELKGMIQSPGKSRRTSEAEDSLDCYAVPYRYADELVMASSGEVEVVHNAVPFVEPHGGVYMGVSPDVQQSIVVLPPSEIRCGSQDTLVNGVGDSAHGSRDTLDHGFSVCGSRDTIATHVAMSRTDLDLAAHEDGPPMPNVPVQPVPAPRIQAPAFV